MHTSYAYGRHVASFLKAKGGVMKNIDLGCKLTRGHFPTLNIDLRVIFQR